MIAAGRPLHGQIGENRDCLAGIHFKRVAANRHPGLSEQSHIENRAPTHVATIAEIDTSQSWDVVSVTPLRLRNAVLACFPRSDVVEKGSDRGAGDRSRALARPHRPDGARI